MAVEKKIRKIKKGDTVEILKDFASGDRGWKRGRRGKVLAVLNDRDQVLVEGVRFIYRHMRKSQQHPRGARIEKEAPVHASNVAVVCPSCLKKTRVGRRHLKDGSKVRFCKKCNENIDQE